VVFKGPAIPVAWKDAGEYYKLASRECVLRVYKKPLRFSLFDKDNTIVIWQESRPLAYGPSTVQTLRPASDTSTAAGCRTATSLTATPR
jgi:hypothetical protein